MGLKYVASSKGVSANSGSDFWGSQVLEQFSSTAIGQHFKDDPSEGVFDNRPRMDPIGVSVHLKSGICPFHRQLKPPPAKAPNVCLTAGISSI